MCSAHLKARSYDVISCTQLLSNSMIYKSSLCFQNNHRDSRKDQETWGRFLRFARSIGPLGLGCQHTRQFGRPEHCGMGDDEFFSKILRPSWSPCGIIVQKNRMIQIASCEQAKLLSIDSTAKGGLTTFWERLP